MFSLMFSLLSLNGSFMLYPLWMAWFMRTRVRTLDQIAFVFVCVCVYERPVWIATEQPVPEDIGVYTCSQPRLTCWSGFAIAGVCVFRVPWKTVYRLLPTTHRIRKSHSTLSSKKTNKTWPAGEPKNIDERTDARRRGETDSATAVKLLNGDHLAQANNSVLFQTSSETQVLSL